MWVTLRKTQELE